MPDQPSRHRAALGLFLVATPLATGLFTKAGSVDRFNRDLRPVFADVGLDRAEGDVATLRAVSDELHDVALPWLAAATGRTDAELHRDLAAELPRFTAGSDGLDPSLGRLAAVNRRLRAGQADFGREDQIPTASLPMVAVPLLFLGSGAGLLALTLVALTGRAPRALPVTLGALALVVAVVPLAWSIPRKAQAVDDLTGAMRTTFTSGSVQRYRADLDEMTAMVAQLRNEGLATFAADLGMTDAQFADLVASQFPVIDAALPRLDAILGRLDVLVATAEANTSRFGDAASIPTAGTPTTVLPWLLIVPAAAAGVLAGGATIAAWRYRPRPPGRPPGGG